MEAIQIGPDQRKLRSSAVKSYSDSYEKLDEFLDMDEVPTKDRRPKKRAKRSIRKKDKLVPCEIQVGEIKTNIISNPEKKLFPIFTSSPKMRCQQKLAPEEILINIEPKIDIVELSENSSQNYNHINQIKIHKINQPEGGNEHGLSPIENQQAGDYKEDSLVISDAHSTNYINGGTVKNLEVLETDRIIIEPGKINTKNKLKQHSDNKLRETYATNGNSCKFNNTSLENDKIIVLKKKNVKGNIDEFDSICEIKNTSENLTKDDPNSTTESNFSEINNDVKIITKHIGNMKFFPIFSNSYNSVKTSKSSPETKEKTDLFSDSKDCVQKTVQIYDIITDSVQTEKQSDEITDYVEIEQLPDNITDLQTEQISDNITAVQTEQLYDNITDCIQSEQASRIIDNSLAISHKPSKEIITRDFEETTTTVDDDSSTIIHPVRTRRKRKLNKSNDTVAVNSIMRITRSQTMRNNSNTSHIATPLSSAKSDNKTAKECSGAIKKLNRNKMKTTALNLLPQSRPCFEKKNNDVKKVNTTELFPLFSKSQIASVRKKSISQLNSSAKKNTKISKSSRTSIASDSVNDLFEEINSNNRKIQTKNNHRKDKNRKTSKMKYSDKETLENYDDSVVEIADTSNLKIEIKTVEQSKKLADLEFMNKIEILEKHTKIVPKKKESNLSPKIPSLPFPLISQCYALDDQFGSSVSKYSLKEKDISDEIIVPIWNKLIGLTDIKSITARDIVLSVQNLNEIIETPHTDKVNNILWTDISNDYNLKEGISESTISELNLWLSEWKSRFSKNDKAKHSDSNDSFDSFSTDSNDSEMEGLSNSVIIMGPPGCGKTSLVFSLANDHGFKVLEVNASSCRSGRNISHQLKEALESYHVENIKRTDLNFQKDTCDEDSALSKPKKNKRVEKGNADYLQKEKKTNKGEIVKKKTTMKNFFKVKSVTEKSNGSQALEKIASKQHLSTTSYPSDSLFSSSSRAISTRTIILFDDIDVVFQEDEGLWSTIRNFLKISKKPVIFTVSRNLAVVKANLDSDIRVLYLKPMIEEIVIKKINNQYETHDRKNSNMNIKLLHNNSNDVRRNLLHAQFWSQPCNLNSSVESNGEVFSMNTFFLGSLNFSAIDFISLILKNKFPNKLSMISGYHKIGYDLLHSNLFTILNGMDISNIAKSWSSVTKRIINHDCDDVTELDMTPENATDIAESDLWKEACKIFELKKQRLQKGSSSDHLFIFSNILENFSFTDSLKGDFYKQIKWISQPERIHMWNMGLPACSEENECYTDDAILDMISLVQILGLQLAQNKYSSNPEFKKDNRILVLEHPFMNCDDRNEVNMQLKSIATEFPASHILNKTVFNVDYLSTLKIMCRDELLRRTKSGKRSNRFLHYFDSISLYIDKSYIEKCIE
ncbi:ATPase family AAA domain-containing protein 5 [Argiope bruennichi]|uniref:ATPase family AAA domain-containing protein 5 n=1 Tax=Argiope bruennichi TaxID=94029 RepID=A0A8T0ETA7_ARGBR|nr:ATPase family AAA domain-containing protein 5 [Argiope bruennichi]